MEEWLSDEVDLKRLKIEERSYGEVLDGERDVALRRTSPTLTRPEMIASLHSNNTHGAPITDHIAAPVLFLDAFERFTFGQIFTPSGFESADLDSEVKARAPAAPPKYDEGEADVESRARSDAEGGMLARAQYLPTQSATDAESESDNNNRTWEADLSRVVALRKREREHFLRMETIQPSSFDHFHSHHSLRRPLSEAGSINTTFPLIISIFKMIPPITNPRNAVKQGIKPPRPTSVLYPPLRHPSKNRHRIVRPEPIRI